MTSFGEIAALWSLLGKFKALFSKKRRPVVIRRGGGAAIRAPGADGLSIQNEGEIFGGRGGSGPPGGDAIFVPAGVKVKIINRGVIAGGDAGE